MGIILLLGFIFCICLNIFIPDEPKKQTKSNTTIDPSQRKRNLINWAYNNEQKIEITYKKFNGEITKRIIQPLTTIYTDKLGKYNEEYIQAFCYLRNEERTFRFDRIIQIKKLNKDI